MYLAIDIGGTKTLVGLYSESGELSSRQKVDTTHDYKEFIGSIRSCYDNMSESVELCVAGVPGLLDREKGTVHALGNLPWKDEPIAKDLSDALGGAKVLIENDTKLAGLAEALAIDESSTSRILYITISTGMSGALVVNRRLVKELEDTEPGHMPLLYEGKLSTWEDIASGASIVKRYGKKAVEITDPATWKEIGERIAYGTGVLCATFQPEIIVFGGSIGEHADKFTPTLRKYLQENLKPVVTQPSKLLGPNYKEDSVLRGCYELAKNSS